MTAAPKISAARVEQAIQNRFAPIRQITPEALSRQLDDFRCGRLDVTRLWDALRVRDDILTSVCAKRLDSIAGLRWEVLIDEDKADGQSAEAARHQEVLQGFYSGLDCTEVINQDMAGGVGLLSRFLLLARFDKYSVLEWVWRPRSARRSTTTAQFRACPTWWFETRSGRMRFLPSDWALNGEPMEPLAWLVATAPHHLMEACSVAWMYKTLPLRDWLNLCEKFGMPGIIGRTNANPGEAEWDNLANALKAWGTDFAMVVNEGAKVDMVQAQGGTGSTPHAGLVEMMNRSMAALIRGADLSTISAGQGAGQGASLQGDERDEIGAGDAAFVSEVLQRRVDRAVVGYEFGTDTEPLAYLRIIPKTTQNVDADIKVDEALIKWGIEMGKDAVRSRYGRPAPGPEEEIIGTPSDPTGADTPPAAGAGAKSQSAAEDRIADLADLANAADATGDRRVREAALAELAEALKAWDAPLRVRLAQIEQLNDAGEMRAAMEQLVADLPRFLVQRGSSHETAAAFEGLLGTSLVNGLLAVRGARAQSPEVSNTGA